MTEPAPPRSKSPLARAGERLLPGRLRPPHPGRNGHIVVWILLWSTLLALLVFLVDAEKPWSPEIWDKPLGDFRHPEWIALGLWWGAALNAVVVATLILTSRWWLPLDRRDEPPDPTPLGRLGPRPAAAWSLVVLAACVTAAWLAAPRLSHSLWGDEEHSLRQCVLGEHRIDEDTGDLYYRPHPKSENLWMYVGPNNHFLFTLTSRLALEVWHATAWQGGLYFNETVYRLPSFLAGLLTVLAVAWLARTAGFPIAGAISAWFLAIHPWFLRYMTEARGYSLMLLFATLAALCLIKALRGGRWLWWGLFALCEFLFLYSYPGALYLAVCMNTAAVAAMLIQSNVPGRHRANQAWRWFVTNTAAAVVAIQLLAPTVPQMALWLQRDRAKADLGLPFLMDVWAFLSTGMAWFPWDSNNPLCHSLTGLAESHPALHLFLLAAPAALLLIGFLRFLSRGRIHACLGVAWMAAAPLAFLMTQAGGNILYVWYLIFALPFVVVFIGLGIETTAWVFVRPWHNLHASAPGLLAIVFLSAFWIATADQRQTIRNHPTEPQRESVLLTRPSLDPYHPSANDIITVNVVFTTPFYDPRAIHLERGNAPETLRRLMREAREQHKALYVNFGSEGLARHVFPEVMDIIDDPSQFILVDRLHGLELQNTRLVYRYLHGAHRNEFTTE